MALVVSDWVDSVSSRSRNHDSRLSSSGLACCWRISRPTHNFFFEPGTGGVSAAYGVVERLGDPSTGTTETIACAGCPVSGGTIVGTAPPPGGTGDTGTTVPEPG